MRVKRLELQGFKSFKDKTVIHFDAGITGIVGPNGCGKSNIVDAFFWSMGEQNARHLRGQAMEDLIFSGSDRSPAANYAEVTLVLEMVADLSGPNVAAGASTKDLANDGTLPTREVAITRKLYRSGESEYFINKTPSRLRDVQELFMDTGVGSRGYSIIQQGQIAKIVQSKPEERRTMIEEVAGIVKYKARRKEAARKLEHTQQNLLRITDVITELETQKRQLERQVDKARKYREWKEKLQSIELRFNALKWEELSEKLNVLEKDVSELQTRDADLTTERETIENIVLNKRIEATSATKVTEENQEKWLRVGQHLNQSENDLRFLQKSLEELRLNLADLNSQSEREQVLVEQLKTEFEELSLYTTSISEQYANAEATRTQAEQALQSEKQNHEDLNRLVQDLQRQQNAASNALIESENKAQYAELRLQELSQDLARLSGDRNEREALLQDSRNLKDQASSALSTARGSVDEIRARLGQTNEEIHTTRNDLETARRNAARLSAEEVTVRSNLNAIEEHKRRHDQSSQGVQSLFQKVIPTDSRLKQAVAGTLADCLSVEKGYETAVEAGLGRYLDLVLTADYSVHAELTNTLRQQGLGRAALADLKSLKAGATPAAPIANGGTVLGPLAQFVHLSAEAEANGTRAILAQLTNHIFVAQDAAMARTLAEQNPDFTFVSLEGELFRGGWYTEGGDKSQVSGAYVGRNREIADFQARLEVLGAELQTARADLQAKEQQLATLEGQKRALEDQLTQAQEQAAKAAGEEASLAAQLREAERALQAIIQDVERLTAEQSRLSAEEQSARNRAAELRQEQTVREESLAKEQLALEQARLDLDLRQQALMEARVQETSLQEQRNASRSKLASAESALRERTTRIDYLLEQAAKKNEEARQNTERSETLEIEIIELRSQAVDAEREYRESKELLDVLNNAIEAERARSQEVSSQESAVKESLTNKRVEFEKLNSEREHMAQNTFERYGLTLSEYAMSPETMEQVQLLRAAGENTINEINNEVIHLREKIRKLGEVNTGAIEEYDQIVERYTFLTTQKADLEKSMEDLSSTIERINKVSKERFDRAFHQVNDNFKRVFPVIFGGGHASLTLTNPEDFVETGVDIMAQPPGKKPQNINLLSGGEKTLTAISLLFAIFLVKPSPFCLLDEVDAPLDDANIGRFNALLREMSKRSQFIIITHNKRTMELNDKLYGVTMENAGVSKMVSIQMTAN